MRQFLILLKHDIRLLYRNRILLISAIVTGLYYLLFRSVEGGAFKDKLLVLVIFNDPALLGFLFIGVMVLFEKDEGSLQALSVTPIHVSHYVLSKVISLTCVSLVCSAAMGFACKGDQLNWFNFMTATIFTSVNFSFLGCIVVANINSFNAYFLKAVAWILLLTTPFLAYFGLMEDWMFFWVPTWNSLRLFSNALEGVTHTIWMVLNNMIAIVWTLFLGFAAIKRMKKCLLV